MRVFMFDKTRNMFHVWESQRMMDPMESENRPGAAEILMERLRQVNDEGWSADHDDQHAFGELVEAAVAYATEDVTWWPWHRDWFKPKSERENLVRAGALIAAEIDRLDRKRRDKEEA